MARRRSRFGTAREGTGAPERAACWSAAAERLSPPAGTGEPDHRVAGPRRASVPMLILDDRDHRVPPPAARARGRSEPQPSRRFERDLERLLVEKGRAVDDRPRRGGARNSIDEGGIEPGERIDTVEDGAVRPQTACSRHAEMKSVGSDVVESEKTSPRSCGRSRVLTGPDRCCHRVLPPGRGVPASRYTLGIACSTAPSSARRSTVRSDIPSANAWRDDDAVSCRRPIPRLAVPPRSCDVPRRMWRVGAQERGRAGGEGARLSSGHDDARGSDSDPSRR